MADAAPAAAEAPVGESKTPLLVALLNSLAVLAALGTLVYMKVVFKRPVITEDAERDRLADLKDKPTAPLVPGLVGFETTTVNILPTQLSASDAPDEKNRLKLQYLTLGFSLEISDMSRKDEIEELKPRIMDRLLALLGKKAFGELTTVQGRYLLRSQIAEIVNLLSSGELQEDEEPGAVGKKKPQVPPPGAATRNPLVSNVYFTQFIVQ
jgi:flagellar basal body-associated protein FliL